MVAATEYLVILYQYELGADGNGLCTGVREEHILVEAGQSVHDVVRQHIENLRKNLPENIRFFEHSVRQIGMKNSLWVNSC